MGHLLVSMLTGQLKEHDRAFNTELLGEKGGGQCTLACNFPNMKVKILFQTFKCL